MNLQLTATNRAVTSAMSPVYMKNSSLRVRPGICARPAFSRVPRAWEINQNEVMTFLHVYKGETLKLYTPDGNNYGYDTKSM